MFKKSANLQIFNDLQIRGLNTQNQILANWNPFEKIDYCSTIIGRSSLSLLSPLVKYIITNNNYSFQINNR